MQKSQTETVINQANQKGFALQRYPLPDSFVITTYEHLPPSRQNHIRVYIEGDGNSWQSKYKLSDNPTPKNPLALKLALIDPHSHVVYLARPCQYTPPQLDPECQPQYWSSHRYAPEVIKAMDETLDAIKKKSHNAYFTLVGYSGGATVAALIAERRDDIIGLITLAGNLDHDALSQHHQVTPLKGSLNPIDHARLLQHLPQQHYVGEQDKIVPLHIAERFQAAIPNASCLSVKVLPHVSHHQGWEQKWPTLVQAPFACQQQG